LDLHSLPALSCPLFVCLISETGFCSASRRSVLGFVSARRGAPLDSAPGLESAIFGGDFCGGDPANLREIEIGGVFDLLPWLLKLAFNFTLDTLKLI
jgi:hypothetical protein